MDSRESRLNGYADFLPRQELLQKLRARILEAKHPDRSTIIGIDGVDLSGKTSLSNELAEIISETSQEVILIHVDDFLQPLTIRTQRGEFSPIGFYEDYFDFNTMFDCILLPIHCGKRVTYSFYANTHQGRKKKFIDYTIEPKDLLIVEGLFLSRKELRTCFDLLIRLKIPPSVVIKRAIARDIPNLGSFEYVRRHYKEQVLPAQAIYETMFEPDEHSDIVIDNSDIHKPIFIKI